MKLYLTGGSGFLGSNIIRVAQENYHADIFTTVNAWQPQSPVNFAYEPVDIGDRDAVLRTVEAFRPDAIIHSAILNNFPLMYQDRKLAWRLYVEATRNLVDAANAVGAKIVLVSTDWVFDGTQDGADESTPPNGINYYGVLKIACEQVLLSRAEHGAVARVSGVNGLHWLRRDEAQAQNAGYGHFITGVLADLQRDSFCEVWEGENVNMQATPSLASDSAEQMMKIITGGHQGVFHCSGSESIGRVDFARRVARAFGYDEAAIRPGVPQMDDLAGIRIPYDTSISAAYTAQTLNHAALDADGIIAAYKRQLETGLL